jgi:hypothetical protein
MKDYFNFFGVAIEIPTLLDWFIITTLFQQKDPEAPR